MNHYKCWICNSWIAEDVVEFRDFEGVQGPVCFECVEALELRNRKLRAIRRTKNVTPSSGSLQSQLVVRGSGQTTNGADSKGQGAESERVGEGTDSPDDPLKRKDQCFTEGCAMMAVYSQNYRVSGNHTSVLIRRCADHKNKTDDLPPGVLEGVGAIA